MITLVSVDKLKYDLHLGLTQSSEFYRDTYSLADLLGKSEEVSKVHVEDDYSLNLASYFRDSKKLEESLSLGRIYISIHREELGRFLIKSIQMISAGRDSETSRVISSLQALSKYYATWDETSHLLILSTPVVTKEWL